MKKIFAAFLCALMLLPVVACGSQEATVNVDDPVATAEAWIKAQINNNTLFSFEYDGVAYAEHIKKWNKTVEQTESGWTVTYKNGDVTAWSEITFDKEMAALEWTNYFKNDGSSNSPVISNIQAIDSTVTVEDPVLTTAKGSGPSAIDFQPITVNMTKEDSFSAASLGGRSSQGAFPYFDLSNGEHGVIGGIGWTGGWKAEFTNNEGVVSIVAGMQETSISLLAGEDMRTPMIMLQFFTGDRDDGHNALRQLILKSYTPADESGKPIKHGVIFVSAYGGMGEDALLKTIENWKGTSYEYLWVDAGWYGEAPSTTMAESDWYGQAGSWNFVEGYTNGNAKKVTDALAEEGKGLILWFEPERVMKDTIIAKEHPEYLLPQGLDSFMVFDMSNDEACDYMIDLISGMIQESNVAWYRQDFNCDPDSAWGRKDEKLGANRIGITEIKYITNLYRYWDTLAERNPGLMFDNCASGGKRLDLEMMKRSIPLWRTDYTADAATKSSATQNGVRSINYNLSWWLPIHGGGFLGGDYTAYNWRSVMSSGLMIRESLGDMKMYEEVADQYFTMREMMSGDYYMLAYGLDGMMEKADACYQYYLEEEGRGFLMCFRPEKCDTEFKSYRMKGLDLAATYEFTVYDTGDKLTMTGEQLMNQGIKITYHRPNSSLLIYYNKI